MPRGLGYAAKRKWLIDNDRADEAEAMRLRANEASRKSRGGTGGSLAKAIALKARIASKEAQAATLAAAIKEIRAELKSLEETLAAEDVGAAASGEGA